MNPFYFGSSDSPLLGVYHAPATSGRAGVLMCYPFGAEYLRVHRAFRQLAQQLAQAGNHVLRFDYFGTGDSAGSADEGDVERWVADIGAAIEELKDTAAVSRVSIVGLRLGAALALLAARDRPDVGRLVLWSPVVSGARYLDELTRASNGAVKESRERTTLGGDATLGVDGFPLTPRMRAGIHSIDLLAQRDAGASEVALVVGAERDEHRALRSHLAACGARTSYAVTGSDSGWSERDGAEGVLVPREVLDEIVRAVRGDGP